MRKICTVQAQSVEKVLHAAAQRGVDPERLLQSVGLERKMLQGPDSRIPNARLIELYEQAATQTGDPDFGLHTSEMADLGMFDVFGYTVLNSPNLEEALRRTMRFYRLWTDGGRLELEIEPREVRFRYEVDPSQPLGRQETEFTLALALTLARRLTGRDWNPQVVRFRHPKPARTAEHSRLFRCPVRFSQGNHELVFAPPILAYPLIAFDPNLGSVLLRFAEERLAQMVPPQNLVEQVRQIIASSLRGGDPSLPAVARRLGLSPRTVQRKLKELETSPQEILDSLRRDFAALYLQDPALSVCETAYLLGFADPSVFNRAFRRWTGLSPQEFRRRKRADLPNS